LLLNYCYKLYLLLNKSYLLLNKNYIGSYLQICEDTENFEISRSITILKIWAKMF